ncbi:hypothetical protein D3C72_1069540 [compost metagenome]
MGRPPVIDAVRPGISARLDGLEPVITVLVRDRAADAAEIRIDGGEIGFLLVAIPPAGIGLPEFHERVIHAAAALVQYPAVNQNARANGHLAGAGIVEDEIVIQRVQHAMAENRPGDLALGALKRNQSALRRAQDRGLVSGCIGQRVNIAVAREERPGFGRLVAHFVSSSLELSAFIPARASLAILKAWLAAGTPA